MVLSNDYEKIWKEAVLAKNLRYYAGTCLERLRKTMKNVSEMVSRLRFELRTSCI
jgi:hypothetical protein